MNPSGSRLSLLALTFLSVLLVNSCSTLKVSSDLKGGGDISQYSTYRWIQAPASAGGGKPRFDSPALREQVQRLVDEELSKRGYRRTDQGNSDLLVGYFASVTNKVRVTQVDTSMGFNSSLPAFVRTEYMAPSTATLIDQFEKGTLIVGVGNARTRQLLWRGSAEAEIGLNDSDKRRQNRIQSAISKMFRGFPKR